MPTVFPPAPLGVLRMAADAVNDTTTLRTIPDFIVPLPANAAVAIEGTLIFSSAATTTGFQFAATPRNAANTAAITPVRFLCTFEYQSTATAWATATQQEPGVPMAVTGSTYVANKAVLCRFTGLVETGTTPGELHMQFRSEVLLSAITVRRGNALRYHIS